MIMMKSTQSFDDISDEKSGHARSTTRSASCGGICIAYYRLMLLRLLCCRNVVSQQCLQLIRPDPSAQSQSKKKTSMTPIIIRMLIRGLIRWILSLLPSSRSPSSLSPSQNCFGTSRRGVSQNGRENWAKFTTTVLICGERSWFRRRGGDGGGGGGSSFVFERLIVIKNAMTTLADVPNQPAEGCAALCRLDLLASSPATKLAD